MPTSGSAPPLGPVASLCPRCSGSSSHPFYAGGVCLRCAGERVLALDSVADSIAPPAPTDTGVPRRFADDLPLRIGPYEIIDEIGCGGMGRVFAARQEGLGRIVALKALPEGRGGVAGLELRFLREAQTAARLRHPHIVTVHESGRADGFVYFSMDYIDGGDLAHRLRERPFSAREAATLVHQLASALAYTHGQGVLHRDVKPSNVLLDGEEPRLADFGLAAQLEPGGDLTAGTGLLGTPHYLAPEALRGGSAALSAASDLYALGVVLYEMLTGRTAFAGAAPAELPNLIETTEPPAPRLLAPAVPRDLETICLKCLEREAAHRYSGAAALAEDLRRFLADEPILAHAPGRIERLRKYARRHRVAVAAAGGAAVVLLAATAFSSALAIRARRAEARAGDAAATSREMADFLQNDLLAQAAPAQGADRDLKLRTVLDRAGQRIEGHFGDRPLVEASLRETLGRTYSALGEYAAAQVHFTRALALRRMNLGLEVPATLQTMSLLADNLLDQSKFGEAERLELDTLALQRRLLGASHLDTLHTMDVLARAFRYLNKLPQAERLQREALAIRTRVQGPDHPDLLDALDNLAFIVARQGAVAEAQRLAEQAAANEQRVHGPEHPDTLTALNNLSVIYREAGRYDETEKLCRQILAVRERQLGPDHHDTLVTLINLGLACRAQRKFAEAETAYRRAADGLSRTVGSEHRDTVIALSNLASVYKLDGKYPEALTVTNQVLEIRRRVLGPEHPDTLIALDNLGSLFARQGRYAEAEPPQRLAWEIRQRTVPQHWLTPAAACQLGYTLMKLGRYAEAEPLVVKGYEEFYARRDRMPPSSRDLLTDAGHAVVEFYTASGRPAEAGEWQAKLNAEAPAK